jgi:transposase
MSIVKQSIGIDISKDTFTACVCSRRSDETLSFSEIKNFKNHPTGFNQLLRWVKGSIEPNVELVFLMEATGVYYESLAHHLHKIKKQVVVVLPNMSKHYFSSLNVKTKTDEVDARVLSRFGVERVHRLWAPPSPILLQLRNLTRYYVQLLEQKTALTNIKHSKEAAHEVQKFILQSNQKLVKQIEGQIEQCKVEIEKLIASDTQLADKVEKLMTIKGVGVITVATIVAETLGFEHFNSSKQLVSYAGYDVVQRESGSSIKGKTRISKKGNRYIRNALYFPAMVATRFNPDIKANYLRIIMKKPSKMVGQVAIQRKLLVLLYTLWKNNTSFIEGYNKVASPINAEATLDSN